MHKRRMTPKYQIVGPTEHCYLDTKKFVFLVQDTYNTSQIDSEKKQNGHTYQLADQDNILPTNDIKT